MSKAKSRSVKSKAASADRIPLTELDKLKKTPKAKQVSCRDAAAQVLKAAGRPMRTKEMIDAMFTKKLWHSDAPTPAATLYSAILRELSTKGSKARFKKTERGLFTLTALRS